MKEGQMVVLGELASSPYWAFKDLEPEALAYNQRVFAHEANKTVFRINWINHKDEVYLDLLVGGNWVHDYVCVNQDNIKLVQYVLAVIDMHALQTDTKGPEVSIHNTVQEAQEHFFKTYAPADHMDDPDYRVVEDFENNSHTIIQMDEHGNGPNMVATITQVTI